MLTVLLQGKLSESWADVTKGAVAENILNLTKLPESSRSPQQCLASPTLWLALASLCVLDADHVERLSSGQWSAAEGQPTVPRVRYLRTSILGWYNNNICKFTANLLQPRRRRDCCHHPVQRLRQLVCRVRQDFAFTQKDKAPSKTGKN